MNDLISRKALLAEYDRVHVGPPGGARKLIENAPKVDAAELPIWATERAYKNGYEAGKKDAVKEFAVRLKKYKYLSSDWSHGEHPFVVEESDIDELAEEMVGDEK
jgi:hypothetical protein